MEPTAWASPMVVVPKKDGSVRICVDYTKLNRSVQRAFPTPTGRRDIRKATRSKNFIILDVASGFWQIPLTNGSELTTFITPFGRYRFTRLPFGISSGPEVFHRAMQHVLQNVEGVDCFTNDVLICGVTIEEHDRRLRQVLDRFRGKGVRLQPSKFKFRCSEVHYYGHVLNGSDVTVNDNRVKAILEMKQPETAEELRRFMGLVAYVSKLFQDSPVPNHSPLARTAPRRGGRCGLGHQLRPKLSGN